MTQLRASAKWSQYSLGESPLSHSCSYCGNYCVALPPVYTCPHRNLCRQPVNQNAPARWLVDSQKMSTDSTRCRRNFFCIGDNCRRRLSVSVKRRLGIPSVSWTW